MDSFKIIPGEVNHTLLLVGGRQNSQASAQVFDFNLTDGSYLYHSSLKTPRTNPKLLRLGGDFILVGGAVSINFPGGILLTKKDMTESVAVGPSRRN
jgi:hypothetical protein